MPERLTFTYPLQVTEPARFRDAIREWPTLFAMFYMCGDISTRTMQPIYESLCSEHASSSVAFAKIKKEEWPGLCFEHDVPRGTSLTFVAFKDGHKVELINGDSPKKLERFVEKHVKPTQRRRSTCDCCDDGYGRGRNGHIERLDPSRPVRRERSRSRHVVPIHVERRERSRSRHVAPVHVDTSHHHRIPANYALPAELRQVHHFGPFRIERPAQLQYRGVDGRNHRTNDVRVVAGRDGRPEATYLDYSGPIAIERTIGRRH